MVRKIDIAQSDSANFSLRYLDERRIDAARLCEFVHLGKDGAFLLRPEIVVIDRYVHTVVSPSGILRSRIASKREFRARPLCPAVRVSELRGGKSGQTQGSPMQVQTAARRQPGARRLSLQPPFHVRAQFL